jgi:hypothetical protein
VRAEFIIGTNQFVDKAGRLLEVGVNFFVLEDLSPKTIYVRPVLGQICDVAIVVCKRRGRMINSVRFGDSGFSGGSGRAPPYGQA